jgi:hypothetical protein
MHTVEMRALTLVSMVYMSLRMVLVSRFGMMSAVVAETNRRIFLIAIIVRDELGMVVLMDERVDCVV